MTSSTIPKVQRAALVTKHGDDMLIKSDHPVIQPEALAPGECLIKLECAGVCHSDLNTKNGTWGAQQLPPLPIIAGHEGVGHVVAIGEHTNNDGVKLGDRVGVKWVAYACLRCEWCRKSEESSCPRQKIHGFTVDGTFQEYVRSYVDHVTPIPDSIESEAAVCILCAGLTVFKGLKQANTIPGNWITLPGAGGGLGHLAVQYCAAMGLRVIAIDTGEQKRDLCLKLGAEKFIDFRQSKDIIQDVKEATGGIGPHAALVTASSGTAYNQAVAYLRFTGTLVCVGMPHNALLNVPVNTVVVKSLKIVGSAIGNRQDAIEALDIAALGKVKCHYGFAEFKELNRVFKDMEEGKIVGRVIVKY